MDFKRLEIIFLCAFLTLNVFLLVALSGSHKDVKGLPVDSSVTLESRLRDDKITLPKGGKLSKEQGTGYYLSGESTLFKGNGTVRTDETGPGKIDLTKNLEKSVQTFLAHDEEISSSQDYRYHLSGQLGDEKFVLAQEYEGLPFYDESSQLALEVFPDQSELNTFGKFSQTHVEGLEALREKQETISEKDAVETLYIGNRIQGSSKLKDSLLAYTKLYTVRGKNVYIPVWFIWIEDTKGNVKVERVNAFSNSIFSANATDVSELSF